MKDEGCMIINERKMIGKGKIAERRLSPKLISIFNKVKWVAGKEHTFVAGVESSILWVGGDV